MDDHFHPLGDSVDGRNADAVQTAAHFVGAVVKLTTSVQFGHDDFSRRNTKFVMLIDRNTSPVISYGKRMIGVEDDFHGVVESREMLVNRVVHHFPNAMMESRAVMGVPEVHSWSFSNGLEPLENLDASSVILFAHDTTLVLE